MATQAKNRLPDVIVNAEDRPCEEGALKIFVLSILKHYPDPPPIYLICPNATAEFEDWARARAGVILDRRPLDRASTYNVKPQTFERLFDLGYAQVLWLDNDIVIGPRFEEKIAGRLACPLLVSEESRMSQHPKPEVMTRAHGWEVGRALPRVINGGLISLSSEYRELNSAWKEILFSDEYRAWQMKPWHERPAHIFADQEVFTCLLCSKRFAHIPVAYLKEGEDIIQMFGPAGFTPGDRMRNAGAGLPPLVHSMGHKPWRVSAGGAGLRQRYNDLHGELSPYVYVAREVVGEDIDEFSWLKRRSFVGGLMRAASGDDAALAGLPLAVFDVAVRRMKRMLKIDRMRTS